MAAGDLRLLIKNPGVISSLFDLFQQLDSTAAAYCRACLSDLPDRLHFDFAVLPNRRRYGPCLESREQSQSY
jgi:hypothetical protein